MADRADVTAFGVAACPATQFNDDDNGRSTSVGQTVRNPAAVGVDRRHVQGHTGGACTQFRCSARPATATSLPKAFGDGSKLN